MNSFKHVLLCIGALLFLGCSGRLPTTAKTQQITRKHFNKYAKKYETGPFGNKKVTGVEVLNVEKINKKLVVAQCFLTIEGPEVFKIRMTIEKGPFGWRYVAWENLSGEKTNP